VVGVCVAVVAAFMTVVALWSGIHPEIFLGGHDYPGSPPDRGACPSWEGGGQQSPWAGEYSRGETNVPSPDPASQEIASECESCRDLIRLLDQVREPFRESHPLLNVIFGWDFEIRCLFSPGSENVGKVQSLYANVVER
jgi:hypothetical protein